MKGNQKIFYLLLLAFLLATGYTEIARAQVVYSDSVKILYPKEVTLDTLSGSVGYKSGSKLSLSNDKKSQLNKSTAKAGEHLMKDWNKWRPNPKKALWLALVLPGAGQIYNRKYWKLPIFYGGLTGCIYALTWNNQMYRDYQQAYKDIMDDDPTTQSYNSFLHLGTTITDANKSYYHLSIFATVAVYALSVIDAYVDASLSNFDISDDLSLHISPVLLNTNSPATTTNIFKGSAIGIGCKLTF